MPRIKVPAVLAGSGGAQTQEVDGPTLADAFRSHAERYGPELRDSVIEDGDIKEFVNVYVNGEEVSHLDGLETHLAADDLIRVIPAASGGRDGLRLV
jgi:molybdopterin converting factor small subunit